MNALAVLPWKCRRCLRVVSASACPSWCGMCELPGTFEAAPVAAARARVVPPRRDLRLADAPPAVPRVDVDAAPVAELEELAPAVDDCVSLEELEEVPLERLPCGIGDIDHVLGGGWAIGLVYLLGGKRGTGKSRLLLDVAAAIAANTERRALWVELEEPLEAIRRYAGELEIDPAHFSMLTRSELPTVVATVRRLAPPLVVINSVQLLETGFEPTSREHFSAVVRELGSACRDVGAGCVLNSQMTKQGVTAGSNAGPQLCDAILDLVRAEHDRSLRMLKFGEKNRGGNDDAIAAFRMSKRGKMTPVPVEVPRA